MQCAFIGEIETWGSADQMLDVVVLNDGRIVAITASRLALYEDTEAFEAGEARGAIEL